MFRNIIRGLAVGAGLLALSSASHAQLIVGDGFSYTPGAITNDNGGTGWPQDNNHSWFTAGGSTPNQVAAGSLTYAAGGNTLATSGNELTTQGSSIGAFRNLPGLYGGDNNQTLWISFLAANTSSANQSGYAGLSLINAYTSNGTYTQTENFFIGQVNGKGVYGFVNDTASNSNANPFLTTTVTDTTTHLLVARLDFTATGSTEVSLYVDPTPGTAPTGAPQAVADYTGSFVFNQVRLQSGGAASNTYRFDELRMGNTYADVAPVAVPVTRTVTGRVGLQNWVGQPQPITFTLTPTGSTVGSVTTQTLTPAADGAFTLPNIPLGTYTLGVKGAHWLRQDVAVDTTGGSVTIPSMTLLGGDANGDNKVGIADYVALSAAYGRSAGQAGYSAAADFNGDGKVGIADYVLLSANYGKQGAP